MHVPWLTAELPGSGGRLEASPSDFVVEEVLAYAPSGEGEHLFVEIEKVDLPTFAAAREIARAAGLRQDAVSHAGIKDKSARARQWLSLPWPIKSPLPPLSSADGPSLRVIQAVRHGHKLKPGHQRANRFTILIRGVPHGGYERASAALDLLVSRGVPNAFGPQRFGRSGDNAAQAIAILRGETRAPNDRRVRSLLVSALQSAIFNETLAARIARGLFATALAGDVMRKHDTGGLFDVTDAAAEQPRVDALAISPTGALPGPGVRKASGEPGAMEEAAIASVGLTAAEVAKIGADGTRRTLRVVLDRETTSLARRGEDAFELSVTLPSGSYATVLLGELIKPAEGVVLREESGD